MNRDDVEQARDLFVRTARDLEESVALTAEQLRTHLREAAHSVLDLLEDDREEEDVDVMTDLERRSRAIAADLRRVERLMRGDQED